MLDFNSESFIWIGKKVRHQDRLFVLQYAYSALKVIHKDPQILERMAITQVDSGLEPEIFKTAFKEKWQNFDHESKFEMEDSDEEVKEESPQQQRKFTVNNQQLDLIPESIWYN